MIKPLVLSLLLFPLTSDWCFPQSNQASPPASEAADAPLAPKPIILEMKKFNRDVARASKQYLGEVEKARKVALAAFAKKMNAAMQRENLDDAVAIKKKIDELKSASLWAVGEELTRPKEQKETKSNSKQPAGPFHIKNGYWMTLNENYGIVIFGESVYWVEHGKMNKQPARRRWDNEKQEYVFSKMAIRKTDGAFKLMNYKNGVLAGLKESTMDKLKK